MDMDNLNDELEFSLDDILNEFRDLPDETPDPIGPISGITEILQMPEISAALAEASQQEAAPTDDSAAPLPIQADEPETAETDSPEAAETGKLEATVTFEPVTAEPSPEAAEAPEEEVVPGTVVTVTIQEVKTEETADVTDTES